MKRLLLLLFFSTFFLTGYAQTITVTSGDAVPAFNFGSSACSYTWTNDNPNIGLAASGTGNTPSFTAINNTNATITATITATPHASGLAYILTSSGTTTRINTETNEIAGNSSGNSNEQFFGIAVSPDGKFIYETAEGGGQVVAIDVNSMSPVNGVSTQGVNPRGIAVSADGRRIYAVNENPFSVNKGSVCVIDAQTFRAVALVPVGESPLSVVVSPDNSKIYVGNQGSNYISEINTTDFSVTQIPVSNPANGLVLSNDGLHLYASCSGNQIIDINTVTRQVARDMTVGNWPLSMVLTTDNRYLYVSNSGDGSISIINIQNWALVSTITVPDPNTPLSLSLTVDGKEVYQVNQNGMVYVISTDRQALVATIRTPNGAISFGHFTSAGPGCSSMPQTITLKIKPYVAPQLNVDPTTISLITTYGYASNSQQFMVQGTALQGNVSLTAPQGFEISKDDRTYAANLSLSLNANGNLDATPVYVRILKGMPAGNLSGNIMITSGQLSTVKPVIGLVTPADLAINATNGEKPYGTTLTGGNTTDFNAYGLASGDEIDQVTISYLDGAAATDNAGVYPQAIKPIAIIGGTGFNINNYIPHYTNGDLKVDPVTLTIKADDKSRYTGEENPAFTATYSGFVNGDEPAQLTALPTFSTSANINSSPGTYAIIVDNAGSVNYKFNYLPGVLTVTSLYDASKIPNTFTPNGDGINDTWNIPGIQTYPNADVKVFNRYGQQVFWSKGYSHAFDGTENGKALPTGVYYYLIKIDASIPPASGSLTIIR